MYACEKLFPELTKIIDTANDTITDNITNLVGHKADKRHLVCVRANIEQEFYAKYITKEWTKVINELVENPPCNIGLTNIRETIRIGKRVVNERDKLQDVATEEGTDYLIKKLTGATEKFIATNDFTHTMAGTILEFAENCGCQLYTLFKRILLNYTNRYKRIYEGMSKEDARKRFREDFKRFREYILELITNMQKITVPNTKSIKDTGNTIGHYVNPMNIINAINIKNEIQNLIPDSLGAMKQFFVTLLITYYDVIHPVIWCQIFAKICDNFFVVMPITRGEFYQFISSQLLLNSGPAILKILQMMRPFLPPDVAKKYNLTKLSYPLLSNNQVSMILNKVLYDINDYKILNNLSASVGHVVIARKVDEEVPIIIKIIKPLSIVQSCSEYNMLKNTFPKNSCEQLFIDNMIYAIGTELDANNEIRNINKGYEYYTGNYNDIYGFDNGHTITTLQVIDGVIVPNCWYALALTLAPGMPISKLTEGDYINKDTKFRASLHRCLDLLVYQFFYVLFSEGFYHGDLHAGNIFFSFKNKSMTLIDFGAVGVLDIFSDDPVVDILLEIIIMSIYNNFTGIMDKLTNFVNSQCIKENGEGIVDVKSDKYIALRNDLNEYSNYKIANFSKNNKKSKKNINKFFNKERFEEEEYAVKQENTSISEDNIYSYLDILPQTVETIVENSEELRDLQLEKGDEKTINDILKILFAFYATNNINIAVKFGELYEFQKAYTLLLGVLKQTKYDSSRMNYAIKKSIMNCGHISKLRHISKIAHITQVLFREKEIYDEKIAKYENDFKIGKITGYESKPIESIALEIEGTSQETKPVENEPLEIEETKPDENEPLEIGETKPVENEPLEIGETKPVENEPLEIEETSQETKPVENEPFNLEENAEIAEASEDSLTENELSENE